MDAINTALAYEYVKLGLFNEYTAQIPQMSAGLSAVYILGNSILAKMFMTFFFRLFMIAPGDNNRISSTTWYEMAHCAQMNEMEWTSIFLPALLYCDVQSIAIGSAGWLALSGSIGFVWTRVIFFPILGRAGGIPFACCRYLGLCMLFVQIYEFVIAK
jgi:uncharacterized MAPEG superfamily protein